MQVKSSWDTCPIYNHVFQVKLAFWGHNWSVPPPPPPPPKQCWKMQINSIFVEICVVVSNLNIAWGGGGGGRLFQQYLAKCPNTFDLHCSFFLRFVTAVFTKLCIPFLFLQLSKKVYLRKIRPFFPISNLKMRAACT